MPVTSTGRARTEARLAAQQRTRTIRTPDQRIADLEAQIEQVKRRAAAKDGVP